MRNKKSLPFFFEKICYKIKKNSCFVLQYLFDKFGNCSKTVLPTGFFFSYFIVIFTLSYFLSQGSSLFCLDVVPVAVEPFEPAGDVPILLPPNPRHPYNFPIFLGYIIGTTSFMAGTATAGAFDSSVWSPMSTSIISGGLLLWFFSFGSHFFLVADGVLPSNFEQGWAGYGNILTSRMWLVYSLPWLVGYCDKVILSPKSVLFLEKTFGDWDNPLYSKIKHLDVVELEKLMNKWSLQISKSSDLHVFSKDVVPPSTTERLSNLCNSMLTRDYTRDGVNNFTQIDEFALNSGIYRLNECFRLKYSTNNGNCRLSDYLKFKSDAFSSNQLSDSTINSGCFKLNGEVINDKAIEDVINSMNFTNFDLKADVSLSKFREDFISYVNARDLKFNSHYDVNNKFKESIITSDNVNLKLDVINNSCNEVLASSSCPGAGLKSNVVLNNIKDGNFSSRLHFFPESQEYHGSFVEKKINIVSFDIFDVFELESLFYFFFIFFFFLIIIFVLFYIIKKINFIKKIWLLLGSIFFLLIPPSYLIFFSFILLVFYFLSFFKKFKLFFDKFSKRVFYAVYGFFCIFRLSLYIIGMEFRAFFFYIFSFLNRLKKSKFYKRVFKNINSVCGGGVLAKFFRFIKQKFNDFVGMFRCVYFIKKVQHFGSFFYCRFSVKLIVILVIAYYLYLFNWPELRDESWCYFYNCLKFKYRFYFVVLGASIWSALAWWPEWKWDFSFFFYELLIFICSVFYYHTIWVTFYVLVGKFLCM